LSAAQYELEQRPDTRNLIVIFSDMLQDTPDFRLERLLDERGSNTKALLDRVASMRGFPDLKGSRVFVFGAGEPEGMSPARYRAVRAFWLEYFERANAKLPEADYGYRNEHRLKGLLQELRRPAGS